MENPNQMGKQRLPDAKLKFVHKVNNHHLGNIEFFSRLFKPLVEGVLCYTLLDCIHGMEEILTHNSWNGGR